MTRKQHEICPAERAGTLENPRRKFLQNPYKILKPYITTDTIVLDIGCGPDFFTIEIAKMLEGGKGKVIAADVQEEIIISEPVENIKNRLVK